MKHILLSCLASLSAVGILLAPVPSQAQGGLLYSTLVNETSPQCGAVAPAVSQVLDEEVQYLSPTAVAAPVSQAFAPQIGYCELLGDHDADSIYWESTLFGKTDALLRPRAPGAAVPPVDMHSLFVSTANPLVDAAGNNLVTPGDVFRINPGGVIEFFITETQVKAAFGIPAGSPANVDAIAMIREPGGLGIILSFENDHPALPIPLQDGDILRIPAGSFLVAPSPYDGCLLVATVTLNSGVVMIPEPTVDAMCGVSLVSDSMGFNVLFIRDVDGLTVDDIHGDVWFCGEGLLGGSVLSTWAGGSIAVLNGLPLGNTVPVPTTGPQVGLLPVVRSLNGLSLVVEACPFVTDTLTPTGPGWLTVETGGLPPGAVVWFLLNFVGDAPGGPADPSTPYPNPCFPQLYPFLTHVGPIITGPTGCASLTGGPLPPLPGWHITAQAVSINAMGVVSLSTPSVFDL